MLKSTRQPEQAAYSPVSLEVHIPHALDVAMPPRVHLVRHGQGHHQLEPLEEHRKLHDPHLTEQGVANCRKFNDHWPEYVHLDLICASPMRRAIETAANCFSSWIPKTPRRRILLQPLAQENTSEPCDVGSSVEVLEDEYGTLVDTSLMSSDWYKKEGVNASTPEALRERARMLRRWLRGRDEQDVVVVGHGTFWDCVTGTLDTDRGPSGMRSPPPRLYPCDGLANERCRSGVHLGECRMALLPVRLRCGR